jgi:hypothetical protein
MRVKISEGSSLKAVAMEERITWAPVWLARRVLSFYGYVEEACEAVAWRAEGDGVVIFEFYEVFSHV